MDVPFPFAVILLLLVVTPWGECSTWWGDSSPEDLGSLCQSDDDFVGQHLGCDCNRFMENDAMLKADCTNKMIGFNWTLGIPPLMNVSKHVVELDFTKNYLSSVDMQTFGNCEGVQILLLGQNNISSFQGLSCQRLLKLDLSRNRLENLTAAAFANLPHLVELLLESNELLFLEPTTFEQMKFLRVLDLSSNKLGMELFYEEEYMLSLKNLESLEELRIANCSLPDFPQYLITGTQNLRTLILSNNLITFIASGVFDQFSETLIELDLSGNLFERIVSNQFLGLSNLQTLTLDKMRTLKAIEEYAFSGLTNLNELSCQMNYYLTSIDAMAFRADPTIENATDSHPKIVRLGDNDLKFIDYPLLVWKTVDILELHRNSWVCDCGLQWASDFYRHKKQEAAILADSYFTCYEPHIFAGVPVVAVNPEEMLCFSPVATIAGAIGIIIFGILLFTFCSIVILNQMGMLPEWVRQVNLFGSNLPAYTRVNPRPNTKARRLVERVQAIPELHSYNISGMDHNSRGKEAGQEPPTDDLEWDNADIGRT